MSTQMNQLKTARPLIIMLLFSVFTIPISLFLNRQTDERITNILFNYSQPLFLLFLGSCRFHRWVKLVLLFLGYILYGYMCLYYMIGFHNHHWGNWQESKKPRKQHCLARFSYDFMRSLIHLAWILVLQSLVKSHLVLLRKGSFLDWFVHASFVVSDLLQ